MSKKNESGKELIDKKDPVIKHVNTDTDNLDSRSGQQGDPLKPLLDGTVDER